MWWGLSRYARGCRANLTFSSCYGIPQGVRPKQRFEQQLTQCWILHRTIALGIPGGYRPRVESDGPQRMLHCRDTPNEQRAETVAFDRTEPLDDPSPVAHRRRRKTTVTANAEPTTVSDQTVTAM